MTPDVYIKLVDTIKWPVFGLVVVLAFLWIFRKQIGQKIEKLNRIKIGKNILEASSDDEGSTYKEIPKSTETEKSSPLDEHTKKKINDANFDAKRGLYYTFKFNNDHRWSCIFAIRCTAHFNEMEDEKGAEHWLKRANDDYTNQNPDERKHFMESHRNETTSLLNDVIQKRSGDLNESAQNFINELNN